MGEFLKVLAIFLPIGMLVTIGMAYPAHWIQDHAVAQQAGLPRTMTYSIDVFPNGVDGERIIGQLEAGLAAWEGANPGLRFEAVASGADFWITWVREPWDGAVANTKCGVLGCRVTVSTGYMEDGMYVQAGDAVMRKMVMHEVGHVLGLEHTAERGHLMTGNSPPPPEGGFDDRGLVLPAWP